MPRKKPRNHLLDIKLMSGKHDVFPDVRIPRKRSKRKAETKPRDMAEKRFELEILRLLSSMDGIVAGKTEPNAAYNSRYNFYGFPDLTIFNLKKRELIFAELKVKGRGLRGTQLLFQEYCLKCGVKYVVVRSKSDLLSIL